MHVEHVKKCSVVASPRHCNMVKCQKEGDYASPLTVFLYPFKPITRHDILLLLCTGTNKTKLFPDT